MTRRTHVVPHARVQSLQLHQGPWQRRLGLADLQVDSPPGPVRVRARHRDARGGAGPARAGERARPPGPGGPEPWDRSDRLTACRAATLGTRSGAPPGPSSSRCWPSSRWRSPGAGTSARSSVALVALVLAGAVLAAVHHAEVVAHRVGEPFGSLVLAVAVTVIEVALIVTLMVSGGAKAESLARDTVFAAVMITCNGDRRALPARRRPRHGVARFNAEGTGAALATVVSLATLSLVLPTFTTSAQGPRFSPAQLAFAAVASLALYGAVRAHPDRAAPRLLPAGHADRRGGPARRCTRTRPTGRGPPGQPRAAARWRSSRWSGWPRSSPRRSRPGSRRSGSRRRSSAS